MLGEESDDLMKIQSMKLTQVTLVFVYDFSGRYLQKVVENSCPVTHENVPDNYQKCKSNDQSTYQT